AAFRFALERTGARASEFAAAAQISLTNASTKLKQLWEQGFLLRRENLAPSGGIEFEYFRIG
ncbi:MAG TPA: DNA-binding protein, partial [Thermoanaerobaculia bacterium]|nr:DNA-binding protein [Thermoanaerobaculia bacterium]